MVFIDNNIGYAVGAIGIVLSTTNAGSTWTTLHDTGTYHYSVDFSDARNGWMASLLTVEHTTDGGLTWEQQPIGTERLFPRSVDFTDSLTGTIVGNSGLILRTTNGGTTWTRQAENYKDHMTAVSYTDANYGTIVCAANIVMHTTDGGEHWTRRYLDVPGSVVSVHFSDERNGTIICMFGSITRTRMGGVLSVKEVYNSTHNPLLQQGYPNPACDIATFRFGVPRQGSVLLDIIDALGNTVASVVSEVMNEGSYEATFDVGTMQAGAYYVRMQQNGQQQTKSLTVIH